MKVAFDGKGAEILRGKFGCLASIVLDIDICIPNLDQIFHNNEIPAFTCEMQGCASEQISLRGSASSAFMILKDVSDNFEVPPQASEITWRTR